jgi:hypothetical protein
MPPIGPLFEKAEGGLKAVLNAMRFSTEDESIAAFLKKYDSLPAGDRERLPWEAIAFAAQVDPHCLTGAIIFALQAVSVNTVKIIALSSHPMVLQKSIEFAQMAGGVKDRNAFHQGMGFLPSPKGPTFINKAVFGASASKEEDEPAEASIFSAEDDLEKLFSDPVIVQEELVPIRQRLLTADNQK